LNKFDNKKIIERLMDIPQMSNYNNIFAIEHNIHHHFGEMFILNMENLKRIKKKSRYIIVYGKNWNIDYDGMNSLGIFDYNNYYFDKYQNKYVVDGIIYYIHNNKLMEKNASEFMFMNCSKKKCYFSYPSDTFAIHIIVKLRKRIKLHRLLRNL
jgi:hypothetical protein